MASKATIILTLWTLVFVGRSALGSEPAKSNFRQDMKLDFALDSLKDFLFTPNGISDQDIDLYPSHLTKDSYRLSRIDKLLHKPLYIDSLTLEIKLRTEDISNPRPLPISPNRLWPLLDLDSLPKSNFEYSIDGSMQAIRKGLKEHSATLSKDEKTFLYQNAPGLFLQNEADTALDAIAGELSRLQEKVRTQKIMELASQLNWNGLIMASSAAWELEIWLIQTTQTIGFSKTVELFKRASKKLGKEQIPLYLGTPGKDFFKVSEGIWIDPGGDDEYQFMGPAKPGAFLLILDLGGRDTYLSQDSLPLSAGNMGIQLIADMEGQDRYQGANFAFGSTLFGYASVFDAGGQDTYEGRCASLGFGFFGLGLIQDQGGHDSYSASFLSEGVGATQGLGLLLDRSGNDQYIARPTFKDDLRYEDHNIHMVQGFGFGLTPDYSGGIGLLRDGAGNDFYLADIFGQGSAYWFALGMLMDEAGDDRYAAYQYAQGAGVHIAIGALIDLAGNDHFTSKGVSQGCGHDLGFGLLFDRDGSDHYFATDMSQGAGSANGLGLLYDAKGQDIYESLNLEMSLGHADMRRDRGSFGFFFDGAGIDRYRLPHGDGSAWRVYNGKTKGNGFGWDR